MFFFFYPDDLIDTRITTIHHNIIIYIKGDVCLCVCVTRSTAIFNRSTKTNKISTNHYTKRMIRGNPQFSSDYQKMFVLRFRKTRIIGYLLLFNTWLMLNIVDSKKKLLYIFSVGYRKLNSFIYFNTFLWLDNYFKPVFYIGQNNPNNCVKNLRGWH